jgi:hypothetical protein
MLEGVFAHAKHPNGRPSPHPRHDFSRSRKGFDVADNREWLKASPRSQCLVCRIGIVEMLLVPSWVPDDFQLGPLVFQALHFSNEHLALRAVERAHLRRNVTRRSACAAARRAKTGAPMTPERHFLAHDFARQPWAVVFATVCTDIPDRCDYYCPRRQNHLNSGKRASGTVSTVALQVRPHNTLREYDC